MAHTTLKIAFLAFLSLVLLAGIASADIKFVPSSMTLSGSHNSDINVQFSVNNTGSVNYTGITFSGVSGSWSNLPASTTLSAGEIKSFSATLHVPQFASGVLNAQLHAATTPAATADLSVAVNIANSPSLSISSIKALTKAQNGTINITNNGNVALNSINLTASGEISVSLSDAGPFSLSPGSSKAVNVNAVSNLDELALGSNAAAITAKDASAGAETSFSYTIKEDFCEEGNVNATKIEISDIEDTSSEDEWKWKPLDDVKVEVKVENKLDKDEDFVVELGLYDKEEKEFVELDGEDTLEKELSLDEDDSDKVSFEFKVPADVEESDGRYVLYVKAYVDGDEDTFCNSYSAREMPGGASDSIEIEKKSNDVALDEVSVSSDVSAAGDTIRVRALVYNIGEEDETKVKITLKNSKLGLNLEQTISSLDSGDSEEVEFSFVIPSDAEDGTYTLSLETEFDYSKSADSYRKSSDDSWEATLKVGASSSSGQASTSVLAGITASLDSDAKAGEALEITVTLKNLGAAKTSFIVGAKDFDSWAVLNSVSERIVSLDVGASKDIKFSFNINKDAAGEKSFLVETIAGNKVETKEIAVNIAESSALSDLFKGNSLIWVIGAVNLVLLILIIVLAVRVLRR